MLNAGDGLGNINRLKPTGDLELLATSTKETVLLASLGAIMKGIGHVIRFVPIPQPELLVGPGSSRRLGEAIAAVGHARILIVTGGNISRMGLLKPLTDALDSGGARYVVFNDITPDAPLPLIEKGIEVFRSNACDAIVAFGGGSPMDAAKAIALAVANPGKSLRQLAGYFRGWRRPITLYAVPTTAGTGSEATVAAVIADPASARKLVLVDFRMVPKMAALDPDLMTGLPPQVTATTGIDALTHAVEAFISNWKTPQSDRMALSAVGLIFDNLRTAYQDGGNLAAREQMALAATQAGIAFTRANVGYVHAIAHQFGGRYHTPHGLANAIMLPHVLRHSLPAVTERLAQLAVCANVGSANEDPQELAGRFIGAVERLIADLDIPITLDALREADIPDLAAAALREAHTGYPVPRYMTQRQCEDLIREVLPSA
ncbi:iron-containing alcohol dehydrogenase [Methyloparacoccus murrellii]